MNALVTTERPTPAALAPLTGYAHQSLEDLLNNLCVAGLPRISRMKDAKWVCVCEMHVSNAATTFAVRSDFDCKTAIAAAKQCAQRVIETLSRWA